MGWNHQLEVFCFLECFIPKESFTMLSFVKPEANCSILYDWNQRPQNIPHLFFDVIHICSNNKKSLPADSQEEYQRILLGSALGTWIWFHHCWCLAASTSHLGCQGREWLVGWLGSHGDPILGCQRQEGRIKGDRITGVIWPILYMGYISIYTYIYILGLINQWS